MTEPWPMLQRYLISDLPRAESLLPQLQRIDQNRRYSNFGPLATEFEQRMTALLNSIDPHPELGEIHVTTMVTCYHALEVGLRGMDLPPRANVLVPAVTFPACPFAVIAAGATPILSDVDPIKWTLTPAIARRVAQNTKLSAVMPVAIYGVPVPVEAWDEFTRDTGIRVIIDAAAAIESQAVPGSAIVAHSMHATKPFGVGEGGLMVSRDPHAINRARVYSNFGTIDRIAVFEGSNTKMSEYHAAVGLVQFERWQAVKERRKALLNKYKEHLAPLASRLTFQTGLERGVVSSLMLRLEHPAAAQVIDHAQQSNIAFHRMYLPGLYKHPHFTNLSTSDQAGNILSGSVSPSAKIAHMPASEMMLDHIVGVPFHPFLGEDDIAQVAGVLRAALDA
ncbi:MAG: DegT/DnrJ/EryC1/StrS family aminotransferase [Pseudomonadota bacterium]|nr:DegT/DnrJ/EryC1/StrS family aminotransferase [Pseudomonadota bacterium]